MALVLDASMLAAWLLPDEGSPETEALLDTLHAKGGLAPDLLRHEMRSFLLVAHRRGRISIENIGRAMETAAGLPIRISAPDDGAVVALALRHNLSAYDAAYLALAKTEGLPLATLDRRLKDAAQAEGVGLA